MIELTEVLLQRPGQGIVARGPVMAAKGFSAAGVMLGPLEAHKGDRIGLISGNHGTMVWELEQPFTIIGPSARSGQPGQTVRFDFKMDVSEDWSVERSAKLYSTRHLEYVSGFNDPSVRVILG